MIIVNRIFPDFAKNWLLDRNGEETDLPGVFNELIMMSTFLVFGLGSFFLLLSSVIQITIKMILKHKFENVTIVTRAQARICLYKLSENERTTQS